MSLFPPLPEDLIRPESRIYFRDLLVRLNRSPFRSRFRLRAKELRILAEKGWPVIRKQAEKILSVRVGPADVPNDGKQTPMRGHPVFIAQHACAFCCRGCMEKWHAIPRGRALTETELHLASDVLVLWMAHIVRDVPLPDCTPDLFGT